MMEQPLVSVVCNCVNHERFVIESIQSVQKQTYGNIELIVVENGSNDNSYTIITEYIKNYPEIKFIAFEKTKWITKVFNDVVKISSGQFLIDLSADDKLLPNCIEKQVNFFLNQSQDVGIVFGNMYNTNEKGKKRVPFFEVNSEGKVLNKRLFKTSTLTLLDSGKNFSAVTAMFRRSHFEALGGYDERLFFEDLDYWLRLSRQYKIAFIDDFLVDRRLVPSSFQTHFYSKSDYSKLLNQSLYKIYKQAIKVNSKQENRILLRRIHSDMVACYKAKLWSDLLTFSWLEIQCRYLSI